MTFPTIKVYIVFTCNFLKLRCVFFAFIRHYMVFLSAAFIMHQQTPSTHIISMKILDLEVKRYLGAFKQFMLYLIHDNIFAVEQLQSVAGTKINRACPSLLRHIERMVGRTSDLFDVNRYNLIDRPLFKLLHICKPHMCTSDRVISGAGIFTEQSELFAHSGHEQFGIH